MNYEERLNYLIPGGAHTYSRGFDQFPQNAPQILERGKGAYVWEPNKTKYLDYGMALRAVTLGYSDIRVNLAAIAEIEKGNSLTRASITELKAAEAIVELIPSAEMVKFAKNGSNVTTAAAKLARAYTGKKYICIPRQHPFFSFDDWFIGTTELKRGIPSDQYSGTLLFDFNNIESLQDLFNKFSGEIAAVLMEPATTVSPCENICSNELSVRSTCRSCPNKKSNFLHLVQALCRSNGALFILDEMITGFRWGLQGAQTYFDLEPDLSTFGKGMANGFSVAVVAGRREVMSVGAINQPGMERTFLLSSTHGGEMSSLGAFLETLKIYKEEDVCGHLWAYGKRLKDGMNAVSRSLGIGEYFYLDGPPVSLTYVTKNKHGDPCQKFRTLFAQEMVKNKVLMPWVAISQSHGEVELDQTLSAVEKSLKTYSIALIDGVEKFLIGSEIKPVFRKYN